jgi:hypothetical protein
MYRYACLLLVFAYVDVFYFRVVIVRLCMRSMWEGEGECVHECTFSSDLRLTCNPVLLLFHAW